MTKGTKKSFFFVSLFYFVIPANAGILKPIFRNKFGMTEAIGMIEALDPETSSGGQNSPCHVDEGDICSFTKQIPRRLGMTETLDPETSSGGQIHSEGQKLSEGQLHSEGENNRWGIIYFTISPGIVVPCVGITRHG